MKIVSKEQPMPFRIAVVTPEGSGAPHHQFASALEAFRAYRRLVRKRIGVEGIFELRGGEQRDLPSAELEAMAWCERRAGYKVVEF